MFRALSLSLVIGLSLILSVFSPDVAQSGPIRDAIKSLRNRDKTPASTNSLDLLSLTSGGLQRTFYVHTPPDFSPSQHLPVVMAFHGGQGTGERTATSSGLITAADQYGFVAVFPNAGNRQWNDGRDTTASNIDDIAFVRSILSAMQSKYGIDRRRVFATGISNGAIFVQRLACQDTSDFAAYAVVAANMPSSLQPHCKPSRAAPIMFFNGTADPMMPYGGGDIKKSKLLNVGAGGRVISTDQTISFWASLNGCSSPQAKMMPNIANDGTTVVDKTYASCSRGAVIAYQINGGGHTWPGSSVRERRVTGAVSKDISATATMLAFFRNYGL